MNKEELEAKRAELALSAQGVEREERHKTLEELDRVEEQLRRANLEAEREELASSHRQKLSEEEARQKVEAERRALEEKLNGISSQKAAVQTQIEAETGLLLELVRQWSRLADASHNLAVRLGYPGRAYSTRVPLGQYLRFKLGSVLPSEFNGAVDRKFRQLVKSDDHE